jgi:hypothetical protein
MTPHWDAVELGVASDSARTAKYRLLQSWYREMVLKVEAGTYRTNGEDRPVGSMLRTADVAARRDLNFLDRRIAAYAEARALEVREEAGALDPCRLFHNMLSSMPLCFNVFGMVRETPEAQLDFVQRLFDPSATAVDMIECEWTPNSSIGDRTAFDAGIATRHADGSTHLVAIETKYTESFSAKQYSSDEYTRVHNASGWFHEGSAGSLTGSTTNQLWRNCLLAAAAESSGEFATATVAVVALDDDPGAAKAISGVQTAMIDPRRCTAVPLEHIVQTCMLIPSLREWATEFRRRYIDVGPIG